MLLRLLTAAALLCAAQTFAQVQPDNHPSATTEADQFQISPYPQLNFDQPNDPADDPVKAESSSRKQLIKLLDAQRNAPQSLRGFDVHSLAFGADCFAIRSYRVVRDDPHSDSTHRDGYTTCVPAARFRMYTTERRGDPPRLSEP